MANIIGYTTGGSASVGTGGVSADSPNDYWSLGKCKRAYLDYLGNKRQEIEEQQEARRYRHAAQWTAAQVDALNKRKQPVVTYNRIARKIDGIVGLVEKLRQDPKAYPRTPKHEEGAELATAVLNYVLDEQEWKAKSPIVAESAAVDGIGGVELEIIQGDEGDPEIGFEVLDIDGFFYDPRSFKLDFSDARFMGIGKWVDPEAVKEMFPDKADEIDASLQSGEDLTSNSDKDQKWFSLEGEAKRVRLVDIWYRHKGGWCWCIFTGALKLMEGRSYLKDEKGREICKFIVFSAAVDHDGDRYGFVRNLKSAQDEINQRRSKALHELNTRRVIADANAFDDIELTRRELARPDGIVIKNPTAEAAFDDAAKQASLEGHLKFLEDAKNEIENFSFNPALIGQGVESQSGRAIALMQQAGMAELGPYILAYRGWKVRVYRAIFNAIQEHWKSERWIRVTDKEGLAQFIGINQTQVDPMSGRPVMVNAIGSLDVDIVLDEGPDHANAMADTYETLQQIIPAVAPMLKPPVAQAAVELLIDVSPLPPDAKKRFREASQQSQQPDPMTQLNLAGMQAKVRDTNAAADLKTAQATKAMAEIGMPQGGEMMQPQEPQLPIHVQVAREAAEIEDKQAAAMQKRAAAFKTHQEALLAPLELQHEQRQAEQDRLERAAMFAGERADRAEDRKVQAQRMKSQATATRGI